LKQGNSLTKKYEYAIAQNNNKIFLADLSTMSTIYVFNKQDLASEGAITLDPILKAQPGFSYYMTNFNFKDEEGLLIVGYKKWTPMVFHRVVLGKDDDEPPKCEAKLKIEGIDAYMYTGTETFSILNSLNVPNRFFIRNTTREANVCLDEIKF